MLQRRTRSPTAKKLVLLPSAESGLDFNTFSRKVMEKTVLCNLVDPVKRNIVDGLYSSAFWITYVDAMKLNEITMFFK